MDLTCSDSQCSSLLTNIAKLCSDCKLIIKDHLDCDECTGIRPFEVTSSVCYQCEINWGILRHPSGSLDFESWISNFLDPKVSIPKRTVRCKFSELFSLWYEILLQHWAFKWSPGSKIELRMTVRPTARIYSSIITVHHRASSSFFFCSDRLFFISAFSSNLAGEPTSADCGGSHFFAFCQIIIGIRKVEPSSAAFGSAQNASSSHAGKVKAVQSAGSRPRLFQFNSLALLAESFC